MRGVGTVNYSLLQLSDRLIAACKAQNKPRPCIPLYCTRSNTSDGTPSVTPLLKGVPNHTECAAFRLLIYIGMEEITMYAQLQLIFQASFVDLESNLSTSKNLAFVHMYKVLHDTRLNEMVTYKELVWDPCIHSSYVVVDVATIL